MASVKGMVKELEGALVQLNACLKSKAQDWDESKHKRAPNGQFGSGSGGSGKASGKASAGSKEAPAPMTRKQKWEKMDQINAKIKEAFGAVREAEFAGVRGEAMIKLKSELRILQAQHKKIAATLD